MDEQQPVIEQTSHQRYLWWLIVFLSLLDVALISLGIAQAQQENRAGIVIQFADGRVETKCVNLTQADANGDGTTSGEEVLRNAGFPVVSEITGLGPAVCKVGSDGCNFPSTNCFCECTLAPGSTCRYWAYSRLENGAWVTSGLGAGSTTVQPGGVEGWSWGIGTVSQGSQPPLRSFNEICALQVATETPSQTASPSPSLTRTPSRTITPEGPTATVADLLVPYVAHLVATWTPSSTPPPSATVARTATRSPTTAQAALAATTTPSSQPTSGALTEATNQPAVVAVATPDQTGALPEATTTPDSGQPPAEIGVATELPTLDTQPAAPEATEETIVPQPDVQPEEAQEPTQASGETMPTTAPAAQIPVLTLAANETVLPSPPALTTTPQPTKSQDDPADSSPLKQYIVFVVLIVVLAAGWFTAKHLRGSP